MSSSILSSINSSSVDSYSPVDPRKNTIPPSPDGVQERTEKEQKSYNPRATSVVMSRTNQKSVQSPSQEQVDSAEEKQDAEPVRPNLNDYSLGAIADREVDKFLNEVIESFVEKEEGEEVEEGLFESEEERNKIIADLAQRIKNLSNLSPTEAAIEVTKILEELKKYGNKTSLSTLETKLSGLLNFVGGIYAMMNALIQSDVEAFNTLMARFQLSKNEVIGSGNIAKRTQIGAHDGFSDWLHAMRVAQRLDVLIDEKRWEYLSALISEMNQEHDANSSTEMFRILALFFFVSEIWGKSTMLDLSNADISSGDFQNILEKLDI